MSTVLQLIDEIFSHVRPPDEIDMTIPQMLVYINSAAQDARNSGWLLPIEDDESITFVQSTWQYSVPATFAYVKELRVENNTSSPSTWDEIIPEAYWAPPRIDDGVPKFFFIRAFMLPAGLKMKVIGQKRPTIYSLVTETVNPGMESFLRERAITFALSFIHSSLPEVDAQRFAMWDRRRRDSELMLGRHPQEFRVKPSSWLVPGR